MLRQRKTRDFLKRTYCEHPAGHGEASLVQARQDQSQQGKGILAMSSDRTVQELSIDTQTIERVLIAANIGDVVTYEALTSAIGRDVQHAARHILSSARRRALRQHRMVFEPVPNVGMKRLDDVGKIAAGRWHLQRSRNQARYALQKATSIDDFDALTNDQKVEHNVVVAQAGVLRHLTSAKSTAKLSGAVSTPKKQLPLRDCLKAMEPFL